MKHNKSYALIFLLLIMGCSFNNKEIDSNDSLNGLNTKFLLDEEEARVFIKKYATEEITEERKISIKQIVEEDIDGIVGELSPHEILYLLGMVSMEKDNGNSILWYYYNKNCTIIISWGKYIDNNLKIASITEYKADKISPKKKVCLQKTIKTLHKDYFTN